MATSLGLSGALLFAGPVYDAKDLDAEAQHRLSRQRQDVRRAHTGTDRHLQPFEQHLAGESSMGKSVDLGQFGQAAINNGWLLLALVWPLAAQAGATHVPGSAPSAAKATCESLVAHDFSGIPDAAAKILTAEVVAATADAPEYCAAKGYIDPQIQFELRLPTRTWNGRYMQSGCGGFCGQVETDKYCGDAVERDFMVAAHNMGHIGSPTGEPFWGNDPVARRDFGTRSPHAMAVVAKTVAEYFYGQRPHHSYLRGCSTGGREGLGAAQFHPDDFDGIIAGDPAFAQRQGGIVNAWDMQQLIGDDGKPVLDADDLKLLAGAVLAVCDALDGVKDGILTEPRDCRFDPGTLQCPATDSDSCLSAAQVAVVRRLYDGPRNRAGQRIYPGWRMHGSELAWGDPGGVRLGLAKGMHAYLAQEKNPPQGYSYRQFDFSTEMHKLEAMSRLYDPVAPYTAPDLKAFQARGGKLIVYHGWADPTVSPMNTLDYYAKVTAQAGGLDKVREWFRVYMVPGMNHCRGGGVPDRFDLLTAIVNWVEKGETPGRIVATQYEGKAVTFEPSKAEARKTVVRTRPIFPYPEFAKYTGNGDVDNAANWVSETPRDIRDDDIDWIWAPRGK
ncbi:tannase/feruloyl esterase family alpha/beta hydrolase [Lysobacter sp. 5GHs7-4]|uniref:tannase/feruloyl esterase family alpha/beta hydrolase n=1 Tax=Lysobacter sp. 5GHs7-4 TaxID=2904253 RepID=UPI001E45D79A|nr:tannase/feruloyl esterase family alpha/beta hydrolase [Lysobacter sp. 5GHs7-4]UHQ24881.1 tannase/feruloyl esterase family alpha/beta hydrolase [Lysobacter sp. 5GHs7-4]